MANNNNQADSLRKYAKEMKGLVGFDNNKLEETIEAYIAFPSATLRIRTALQTAKKALDAASTKARNATSETYAATTHLVLEGHAEKLERLSQETQAFLDQIPAPQFPEVEQLYTRALALLNHRSTDSKYDQIRASLFALAGGLGSLATLNGALPKDRSETIEAMLKQAGENITLVEKNIQDPHQATLENLMQAIELVQGLHSYTGVQMSGAAVAPKTNASLNWHPSVDANAWKFEPYTVQDIIGALQSMMDVTDPTTPSFGINQIKEKATAIHTALTKMQDKNNALTTSELKDNLSKLSPTDNVLLSINALGGLLENNKSDLGDGYEKFIAIMQSLGAKITLPTVEDTSKQLRAVRDSTATLLVSGQGTQEDVNLYLQTSQALHKQHMSILTPLHDSLIYKFEDPSISGALSKGGAQTWSRRPGSVQHDIEEVKKIISSYDNSGQLESSDPEKVRDHLANIIDTCVRTEEALQVTPLKQKILDRLPRLERWLDPHKGEREAIHALSVAAGDCQSQMPVVLEDIKTDTLHLQAAKVEGQVQLVENCRKQLQVLNSQLHDPNNPALLNPKYAQSNQVQRAVQDLNGLEAKLDEVRRRDDLQLLDISETLVATDISPLTALIERVENQRNYSLPRGFLNIIGQGHRIPRAEDLTKAQEGLTELLTKIQSTITAYQGGDDKDVNIADMRGWIDAAVKHAGTIERMTDVVKNPIWLFAEKDKTAARQTRDEMQALTEQLGALRQMTQTMGESIQSPERRAEIAEKQTQILERTVQYLDLNITRSHPDMSLLQSVAGELASSREAQQKI